MRTRAVPTRRDQPDRTEGLAVEQIAAARADVAQAIDRRLGIFLFDVEVGHDTVVQQRLQGRSSGDDNGAILPFADHLDAVVE